MTLLSALICRGRFRRAWWVSRSPPEAVFRHGDSPPRVGAIAPRSATGRAVSAGLHTTTNAVMATDMITVGPTIWVQNAFIIARSIATVWASIAATRRSPGWGVVCEGVMGRPFQIPDVDRAQNKSVCPSFGSLWKKEASTNPSKYTPEQLERMRAGKAPLGKDGYSMEWHHQNPIERGGANDWSNLRAMTRTEHRFGSNYLLNHPR